jgi:hypothetical protein
MDRRKELYAQTLQRAATKVGGVDELSKKLRVRSQFIASWIEGKGIPPKDVFLRAADLLYAPGERPRTLDEEGAAS